MDSYLTIVQINYRMRITLNDGRQMTGQMLAFDKVYLQTLLQRLLMTDENSI